MMCQQMKEQHVAFSLCQTKLYNLFQMDNSYLWADGANPLGNTHLSFAKTLEIIEATLTFFFFRFWLILFYFGTLKSWFSWLVGLKVTSVAIVDRYSQPVAFYSDDSLKTNESVIALYPLTVYQRSCANESIS